jgi:hypothetical protein
MTVKLTRSTIDNILNGFVTSAQAKNGTNGGLAYSAGFFQMQLAALLVDAPADKQLEVIEYIVQTSLEG